jgi:hypothetical protein
MVAESLTQAGAPDAERRTIVIPLKGRAMTWLMLVARTIVFLPLFVFLVLQGLILVARPSSERVTRSTHAA